MAVPGVQAGGATRRTAVDDYWAEVTVRSQVFSTAAESASFLAQRSTAYPLFAEYMDAYGDHSRQVVLDYGCGPGHDTIGFLLNSNPERVIGLDVSAKALAMAAERIELHGVDPKRVQLVQGSDASDRIPLDDGVVDYVHCLGVIHHTTHPGLVLREIARVMKPGARGSIMVYNRDSIFFHLWIAYQQQLVNGYFPGLSVDEAFAQGTDGEGCPISRAYRPPDFVELCLAAGLETEFVGGYFATLELDLMRSSGQAAVNDDRLGAEHRNFLRDLTEDDRGYYLHQGRTAGHGGVYAIRKPK